MKLRRRFPCYFTLGVVLACIFATVMQFSRLRTTFLMQMSKGPITSGNAEEYMYQERKMRNITTGIKIKTQPTDNTGLKDSQKKIQLSKENNSIKKHPPEKSKISKLHKENLLQKTIAEAKDFLKHAHFNMTTSVPVLLVTYMRSGSSWLGSITSKAPGTFYLWEPLMHLIDEGYITNGSNCACMNNDICRKPAEDYESHYSILKNLYQLFSCDLDHVHAKVLNNLRKRNDDCSRKLREHPSVKTSSNKTVQVDSKAGLHTGNRQKSLQTRRRPTLVNHECMEIKKDMCRRASFRVIKTIRVSMSVAHMLMELISNLKVVHLIRDPRAVINSRGKERVFKLTKDTDAQSRGLCSQIYDDIIVAKTMKDLFPDRITTVLYERLAENPEEVSKSIFKSLDTNYHKTIEDWIYKSTHAQKDNGYYGTERANSVNAASQWRKEMSFDKVKIIQQNCEHVLQSLGLTSFKSETDFRNLNISIWTSS